MSPKRKKKDDRTDFEKLDYNTMIAQLAGEALCMLGRGTNMRALTHFISRCVLNWQTANKDK